MLRRIGLSLSLLASLAVMVPLVSSTAHNLRFQFVAGSARVHHSRAWWRRHRSMMRRRQAAIAKRRAMIAALRSGVAPSSLPKASDNHAAVPGAMAFPDSLYRDGSFTTALPSGWSAGATANGSSTFRIASTNGTPEAHASLAVVAPAAIGADQAFGREQRSSLGGVPFADLRRSVIDKMIGAGGWVVNDRQRVLNGHRVFEVIAQTPATGDGKPEQVWNFYFTEINGKVYSLTTHTAGSFTEKLTADAEKFLSTIPSNEVSQKAPK